MHNHLCSINKFQNFSQHTLQKIEIKKCILQLNKEFGPDKKNQYAKNVFLCDC
jgi:hypothetical protein